MKKRDEILEARRLRAGGKTLTQICLELSVPKTTVYGWIKDMPVPIVDGESIRTRASRICAARMGRRNKNAGGKNSKNSERYRRNREFFYRKGWDEYDDVVAKTELRDFVSLYLAEGFKRTNHTINIVNTDPDIIVFCSRIIRRMAANTVTHKLICSEEERGDLLIFWSNLLGLEPSAFQFMNKPKTSSRRATYGLMTVIACDVKLFSRLRAWMDRFREELRASGTKLEYAPIAHLEERSATDGEVAGSTPVGRTI